MSSSEMKAFGFWRKAANTAITAVLLSPLLYCIGTGSVLCTVAFALLLIGFVLGAVMPR